VLADGVWAKVIVGSEHLWLFSEHSAQGVQTNIAIKSDVLHAGTYV